MPTTTRAGAVAADGIALTKVARKALMAKQMATTTLVRPVRPPAPIPEALSTKVVVFDVRRSNRWSGDRIREQRLVHLGLKARARLHGTLIFLTENAAAASGSDKSTESVKRIRNAERKNRHKNKRKLRQIGKQRRQTLRSKDRAKCRRKRRTGLAETHRIRRGGHTHWDTEQSGDHNADKDRSPNLADQKHDSQHKTDQKQPERRLIQRGDCRYSGIKLMIPTFKSPI